jgi:hypothetical protein
LRESFFVKEFGMKKRVVLIVCFVLYITPFANATIYVDDVALAANSLTISNASYNSSNIRLTGNSILNICSNGPDVSLQAISAFDNTSVNIISNAPVLVMHNLMDIFWTYEDLQIKYPPYIMVSFWRPWSPAYCWEIARVYSPDNAVINISVPEPATIALFGIAVPLILRKKRQN